MTAPNRPLTAFERAYFNGEINDLDIFKIIAKRSKTAQDAEPHMFQRFQGLFDNSVNDNTLTALYAPSIISCDPFLKLRANSNWSQIDPLVEAFAYHFQKRLHKMCIPLYFNDARLYSHHHTNCLEIRHFIVDTLFSIKEMAILKALANEEAAKLDLTINHVLHTPWQLQFTGSHPLGICCGPLAPRHGPVKPT